MHEEQTNHGRQYLAYVCAYLSLLEGGILTEQPAHLVLDLKLKQVLLAAFNLFVLLILFGFIFIFTPSVIFFPLENVNVINIT
jgi:hypothetical protein